jgi:hypothetical protein
MRQPLAPVSTVAIDDESASNASDATVPFGPEQMVSIHRMRLFVARVFVRTPYCIL